MLTLTPETLAAAYDYLRTTQPFHRWNLPEPEDITFRVTKSRWWGRYIRSAGRRHTIEVSGSGVGHTQTLMFTMAHEMVHLHESHTGADRGKGEHSAAFKKWSAQVCRRHGFDFNGFTVG